MPWRRTSQSTRVFLPGESPWTEEPGRLQPMGSQRVGHRHDWVTKHIITSRVILVLSSHSFFFFNVSWFPNSSQHEFNISRLQRTHRKEKGKVSPLREFYLCRSPCQSRMNAWWHTAEALSAVVEKRLWWERTLSRCLERSWNHV